MNPNPDDKAATPEELKRAAEQVMQDGPPDGIDPSPLETLQRRKKDLSEKLFPSEESRMQNDLPNAQRTPPAGATQFDAMRNRPLTEAVVEPAVFPKTFWSQVDYLLTHPHSLQESMKRDEGLPQIALILIAISIIMGAIYGAVMGSTNLLQGAAQLSYAAKFTQILVTAIKVPVLLILSGLIVYFPIYVSNAFMGERHSWRQVMVLLLSSTAITCTVLASMATVSTFFAITSISYDFIKLLHVAIFAYSGAIGLQYLLGSIRWMQPTKPRTSRGLIVLWLLLYMFVGMQLAWVLRPFVCSPNEQFHVFRPRTGNFYESVFHSLGKVLQTEENKPAPRR